ncbi:MAG: 6-phospho-beta-glucosidase [Anaerolineales bacterium]|nr:6-phospho-beta-glucosidase [Anaerolineales bacterium]
MKVCVIGGGSTYTPELVKGFIDRKDDLPISELWLMDIDPNRLEIVGGFAKRMTAAAGSPFEVMLSMSQTEAIQDSSYVITQLRVGKMAARRQDEYLGQRHGLIGQETTGVGGMAKALRTIPVLLSIAADMAELSPEALLVNFTNPAGLVTEALSRYAPQVPSVGLCNAPITIKMNIIDGLAELGGREIDPQQAVLDMLGLNHLSWCRGFKVGEQDIWSTVFEKYLQNLRVQDEPEWDVNTIEALGMIPNYYLAYYYRTARKLAEQENWPPSRAEEVMGIETRLLEQYAQPELEEPPEDLMARGGAYYSTLATHLLNAHYNDLDEVYVLNIPHQGAIAGWPKDWVVELPCRVGADGIHPIPADPLPLVCDGLVAQVKSYELLTVEAAVHGDRTAAYHALLANPLGPSIDDVETVLEDMLTTHRQHLRQFWEKNTG